jgi:hypothetical protein
MLGCPLDITFGGYPMISKLAGVPRRRRKLGVSPVTRSVVPEMVTWGFRAASGKRRLLAAAGQL